MPHGACWLTSLLHLVPGREHQALADGAGLQVVLVQLHVLAEAEQDPVPCVGAAAEHELEDVAGVAPVAAQQFPGRQQLVLPEHGDAAVRVQSGQELPALAPLHGPDAALAVGEGDGPRRLEALRPQKPQIAPPRAHSHQSPANREPDTRHLILEAHFVLRDPFIAEVVVLDEQAVDISQNNDILCWMDIMNGPRGSFSIDDSFELSRSKTNNTTSRSLETDEKVAKNSVWSLFCKVVILHVK